MYSNQPCMIAHCHDHYTSATHFPLLRTLLVGVLALAPLGVVVRLAAVRHAAGDPAGAVRACSSSRIAQQQQTRDQLQKSQLQQQLHQGVSDNAKRPSRE